MNDTERERFEAWLSTEPYNDDPAWVAWEAWQAARALSESCKAHIALSADLNKALAKVAALRGHLEWIADRCPASFLDNPTHEIHRHAAYDAGACARYALAAGGE